MTKESPLYKLTLTKEQAQIVSRACELYARIRVGQFDEIIRDCLEPDIKAGDFCQRKEIAVYHLLEARKEIYPELNGFGHSYGIGKFEDADISFDVYQVIRYALGSDREPWSMRTLPECEVEE